MFLGALSPARFEDHERADRNDDEKDDQAAALAGAQERGRAVAAEQPPDHGPLPEKQVNKGPGVQQNREPEPEVSNLPFTIYR